MPPNGMGCLSRDKTGPEATEETGSISASVSGRLYEFPAGFLDMSKDDSQVTLLLKDTPWLPTTQGIKFHLSSVHRVFQDWALMSVCNPMSRNSQAHVLPTVQTDQLTFLGVLSPFPSARAVPSPCLLLFY